MNPTQALALVVLLPHDEPRGDDDPVIAATHNDWPLMTNTLGIASNDVILCAGQPERRSVEYAENEPARSAQERFDKALQSQRCVDGITFVYFSGYSFVSEDKLRLSVGNPVAASAALLGVEEVIEVMKKHWKRNTARKFILFLDASRVLANNEHPHWYDELSSFCSGFRGLTHIFAAWRGRHVFVERFEMEAPVDKHRLVTSYRSVLTRIVCDYISSHTTNTSATPVDLMENYFTEHYSMRQYIVIKNDKFYLTF